MHLKKNKGKKRSGVRNKSSSICRRTMTLKSGRGNILIFLSVVVTTGARTRVTLLILAKKPRGIRLGLRLFIQQYNYKTCFLQKTKCREDFNADPLSNPTILVKCPNCLVNKNTLRLLNQ